MTRLAEREELLGRSVSEIAATLITELTKAMAGIEAGLADGDLAGAALAAPPARHSALVLKDQPMLKDLGGIEAGLADGDLAGAALAAHAARNSALMLNAQPMLKALGEIEAAARVRDEA